MVLNRIALALVLAGLATPVFAEKCVGSCDFNDEPLVVKGGKDAKAEAAGPKLGAAPGHTGAGPIGGSGNDTVSSGFGNDVIQRRDRIGATALPPALGVDHSEFRIVKLLDKATPILFPVAPRPTGGDRPMGSMSPSSPKGAHPAPTMPAARR